MTRTSLLAAAAAALLLASPACAAGIDVNSAWARPSMVVQNSLGTFMTLVNASGQADRLVAASSPLSPRASLHDHAMGQGNPMSELAAIDLPAGATVTLEPGHLHVMLFDLAAVPPAGTTFPLTLRFERGGEATVTVEVKPAPAKGMMGGMMGGMGQ